MISDGDGSWHVTGCHDDGVGRLREPPRRSQGGRCAHASETLEEKERGGAASRDISDPPPGWTISVDGQARSARVTTSTPAGFLVMLPVFTPTSVAIFL